MPSSKSGGRTRHSDASSAVGIAGFGFRRHPGQRDRGDEFVVIDVMSVPAIAAAPKRRRSASDLRRLLPYVRPYRTRWIVMISAAIASLGAYRRV
jgi:hypothetical protein